MSFGLSKFDHSLLSARRHQSTASGFAYVKKMLNQGLCEAAQQNLYSAIAQMGMYRAQSESSSLIIRHDRENASHEAREHERMKMKYARFWGTITTLDRQIKACRRRSGG